MSTKPSVSSTITASNAVKQTAKREHIGSGVGIAPFAPNDCFRSELS